jgi:hypothetical protein
MKKDSEKSMLMSPQKCFNLVTFSPWFLKRMIHGFFGGQKKLTEIQKRRVREILAEAGFKAIGNYASI